MEIKYQNTISPPTELTCELCEITKVERFLSQRLKDAAQETYRQLSDKQRNDNEEIKCALVKAYRTDSFLAFDQFTRLRLRPEEIVDEFLTDLQRLAQEMSPEC